MLRIPILKMNSILHYRNMVIFNISSCFLTIFFHWVELHQLFTCGVHLHSTKGKGGRLWSISSKSAHILETLDYNACSDNKNLACELQILCISHTNDSPCVLGLFLLSLIASIVSNDE